MEDERDYLGTGWSFPPSFGEQGAHVELVSGSQDVEQSFRIITSTRRGERNMRPEFGCNLDQFIFSGTSSSTLSEIQNVVKEAFETQEPRVRIESVSVEPDGNSPGLLEVRVDFIVLENNARRNMVFPFYLKEANLENL